MKLPLNPSVPSALVFLLRCQLQIVQLVGVFSLCGRWPSRLERINTRHNNKSLRDEWAALPCQTCSSRMWTMNNNNNNNWLCQWIIGSMWGAKLGLNVTQHPPVHHPLKPDMDEWTTHQLWMNHKLSSTYPVNPPTSTLLLHWLHKWVSIVVK